MTEAEARHLLNAILDDLGVAAGDTVYLAVDMAGVPLPFWKAELSRAAIRARQERWCGFLFDMLMARLGPQGTILAPTFSYGYARGEAYVHEDTPSETGPFTEWFRRHPQAVRSLHPIHSVAAVGAKAEAICGGLTGKAAYGTGSVFARLPATTKFLCLGATLGASLTYAHHLEQMYGVNHRYTKIFDTPVTRSGQVVAGPWLCFMRYLGTPVRANVHALEAALRDEGALAESPRLPAMQCVGLTQVDDIAGRMLAADPWAFTKEKVEIRMEAGDAAEIGEALQACDRMIVRFRPVAE